MLGGFRAGLWVWGPPSLGVLGGRALGPGPWGPGFGSGVCHYWLRALGPGPPSLGGFRAGLWAWGLLSLVEGFGSGVLGGRALALGSLGARLWVRGPPSLGGFRAGLWVWGPLSLVEGLALGSPITGWFQGRGLGLGSSNRQGLRGRALALGSSGQGFGSGVLHRWGASGAGLWVWGPRGPGSGSGVPHCRLVSGPGFGSGVPHHWLRALALGSPTPAGFRAGLRLWAPGAP